MPKTYGGGSIIYLVLVEAVSQDGGEKDESMGL